MCVCVCVCGGGGGRELEFCLFIDSFVGST